MLPSINVALVNLSIFVIHMHVIVWTIKGCSCLRARKHPPKKAEIVKHDVKRIPNKSTSKPAPQASSGSATAPTFPVSMLAYPLAPTPPEEETKSKEKSAENIATKKRSREKREVKEKDLDSRKLLPYPEVKPPTLSQKKRREYELEKEKREKIASGFYQSRSDEDDTLEKVNSLKEELTEQSRKLRSLHLKPGGKADKKDEKAAPAEHAPPSPAH